MSVLEIYLKEGYVIIVDSYDSVQEVKSGLERKEKFISVYYAGVEVDHVLEPSHYCIINTDNIIFVKEVEKEQYE